MRILLDTHALIWHLEDDPRLSIRHSEIISNAENQPLISIATIWEIAIKISIGKLSLQNSVEEIVAHIENSASSILPIDPKHAIRASKLPFHHRDPFDRMIIAQALVENTPVIGNDGRFGDYGVELL